ncbi:MotA/TolQ/ExbB proton channel family protein [Rivihabitans pingtungensis]|jgi:biopolymer transport protein ExbB/TolQ|uniref:MotA/TolQ/ExbB proton channel family protein n=1 Tax=Rivihabitans pingtungensis TaxID=1054498 RepID=UPI0023F549F1|nr:MotA/TolQ/ExbB proton channel family protein [Rivihabitans pingtungensis]
MLSLDWLHAMVSYLLPPALWALLLACAVAVFDLAVALGERLRGLRQLRAAGQPQHALALARRRLERADLLARLPPMLGLMATIIPLGPGLAALGQGQPALLASAITTAFDATVLGLAAGMVGLVLGKLRRRWYEELLEEMA